MDNGLDLYVGLVGSRESYFPNPEKAKRAFFRIVDEIIADIEKNYIFNELIPVSGKSPELGVDEWAKIYSDKNGYNIKEIVPLHHYNYTNYGKGQKIYDFMTRNELIANRVDVCYGFLGPNQDITDKARSGTMSTIRRTIKQNKPVVVFRYNNSSFKLKWQNPPCIKRSLSRRFIGFT